jgi:hypothetical protein
LQTIYFNISIYPIKQKTTHVELFSAKFPGGVYWTKFECISGKIRRILTNDTCASHAPFARDPKTKNFLTIPFSAGGVGGAGKKWKGKFLVLVPTLHSSRKDLYLYFSIVAIFCPSFPSSFASVRGAHRIRVLW